VNKTTTPHNATRTPTTTNNNNYYANKQTKPNPSRCMHAVKPQLPDNFEETSWAKLSAAVDAVHNKRPVAVGLEELYRVSSALFVIQ
jgi:hypothetical protein